MKIKWTLYSKIQALIVLVLLVIYIISTYAIVQVVEGQTKNSFYTSVESTSILLQRNIEVIFNDAKNVLDLSFTRFEDVDYDREHVVNHLDLISNSSEGIVNCYVSFSDGSSIVPTGKSLPEGFDPRQRTWYKAAYGSSEYKWSDLYVDVLTNTLVITASGYRAYEDLDAVVGLDLNLERISQILKSTKVGNKGLILLMDGEGNILSSSLDIGLNNFKDIDDQELLNAKLITGSLETKKGLYYFRQLNRANVRVMAFLPKEDLESAIGYIQTMSMIIISIALFFGLLISYFFAKRLVKPIKSLGDTMVRSSQIGEMILHKGRTNDEVNTLIKVYNKLATDINLQNKKLKDMSLELINSDKKLHEQYIKTAELAYADYLTGLPNRVKFEQIISEMIEREERLALMYIDIDNFKLINDTYGHSQGDHVIKVISQRFENAITNKSLLSRLSGDEFGIIIPLCHPETNLEERSNSFLKVMSQTIKFNNLEFEITGSMGISIYPDNAESFEALLSYADIAMYEAKERGKNQFVIYNEQLKDELIHKVNLETKLLQSIEKDEILVYYQPLIKYETKEIDGFEALVRWEEKEMGTIFPDVFIPIAEHSLFINQLGYHILRESIKYGSSLKERYGKYYTMNVNVSAIQLHVETFVDDVIHVLKEYNYPPGFLNLEITESVALETDKSIIKKLSMLRKVGISLSLDDFGTGYSSLNHLLNLSLTHLKIDRSLIVEAVRKDEVYRLIKGIVDFAHTIHLQVVAEGIEDAYMEQMMGNMSVDLFQGYLYSRPLNDKQLIDFIDQYTFKN